MSQVTLKPVTPKAQFKSAIPRDILVGQNVIYEHNTVSDLTHSPALCKICLEAEETVKQ